MSVVAFIYSGFQACFEAELLLGALFQAGRLFKDIQEAVAQ